MKKFDWESVEKTLRKSMVLSSEDIDYKAERESNRRKLGEIPLNLIIRTWVPSKWRFVDLETGDIWKVTETGPETKFERVDFGKYEE